MRMFPPLLAAIGSLFAADPVLHAQRRRQKAAPTANDKAQSRAADRKRELDRLSLEDARGCLTAPELERMQHLRLRRGKLARRMARRPKKRTKGAVPAASNPLRLGQRIPHAGRVLLLQQEGRPISGRQWRQLRKAARRQERAG